MVIITVGLRLVTFYLDFFGMNLFQSLKGISGYYNL